MSNHSWAWRKGVVVGAAALMLALPTGGFARQSDAALASKSIRASSVAAAPGSRFTAQWQDKMPTRTAEQTRRMEAASARTHRAGPAVTQAETATRRHGPEAPAPDTASATGRSIERQTPDTLTLFRDTIIPGSQVSPSGSSYVSNTQEPSVGANGKYNFQVGNWYATRSVNNGASWQYLDPFVQFGSNFCCDQVAVYEPGRNLMFWLTMGVEDPGTTGNHLQLAVSAGNDLTSWCAYTIPPSFFGQLSTTFLDYQDMAFSNDFLWITTNPFPAAGGNNSAILRMPLDGLAACAGFSVGFLSQSDWFNWKPVQGAQETMYWASVTPISGVGLGTTIRIYRWHEDSGTIFFNDRAIPAFTYMSRNSGQNCAGGAVNNWCNYADSRSLGGYLARGVLGWSWNAKQDGTHAKPYTRLARFAESTQNYLSSSDYASGSFSIMFMTWSPNARGHLAATFAWGGSDGVTNWYPATGFMIQDDYTVPGPGSWKYLGGGSNACPASNGIVARWGDYLTIRPWFPSSLIWVAVGMRNMNGGPCTVGGRSEVRNFVLGRERDANSYHRWKNS